MDEKRLSLHSQAFLTYSLTNRPLSLSHHLRVSISIIIESIFVESNFIECVNNSVDLLRGKVLCCKLSRDEEKQFKSADIPESV